VGMGVLSITKDKSFSPDSIMSNKPNARLCLSLAAFEGIEKYDSYYRLKTKFGKLGGLFATQSPTGGNPKPFKHPVLMYEPGAVFLCSQSLSDKPLLKDVHPDQRIRHCGVPITLPFRLTEDFAT
jgi:CRISPR-associated protein Csm4